MGLTRVIGDIHGKFKQYKSLLEDFDGPSVQVGDFGVGFFPPQWDDEVSKFHASGNHRFIRGNHDNLAKCKTITGFIEDGYFEDGVMYIGGAWSVDWAYRTEGVNWWRDEELSMRQVEHLIHKYEQLKPRVMITHDGPSSVTRKMFIETGKAMVGLNAKQIKTTTGEALQTMFEIHQPQMHIFGHWHHTVHQKIDSTHFICLGELDYIDVEI